MPEWPGIDSEDLIPPAYVAWLAGTTNRVVVPARHAGNRFLGSLKGLQIRAQLFNHICQLELRLVHVYCNLVLWTVPLKQCSGPGSVVIWFMDTDPYYLYQRPGVISEKFSPV